ncbi:MAG: hypothetical protein V3W50_07480 [Thermoanaerobaculia bacterium]
MKTHPRSRHALLACWAALLLAAALPATAAIETAHAIQAQTEIPEEQLLDVGIEVFDPGLPEETVPTFKQQEKGVFTEVRNSEARYIPFHLKDTLQATGHWGAVRVVPAGMSNVELTVKGQIIKSNGKNLVLTVQAVDATSKVWFDKRYKGEADIEAYLPDQLEIADPFQALYNTIANDLLAARSKLKPDAIEIIREVAGLKFAADLAPEAFADYLETNRKGRHKIERLPAAGNPMVARIAEIRERDYMFVDTLNEHYAQFCTRMDRPYDDWRAFSYEEQVALQELRRAARMRKILGALAIFGAVIASVDSGIEAAARDAAIIGGTMAIQSGIAKGKEAKMHAQALRELGVSFEAEVAPMVIEVKGQTLRLAGSAETQYASWRELLTEIYAEELGLPVDPNTGGEITLDQPATD